MLRVMDRGHGWIRKKATASLYPAQVETTLARLIESWATTPALVDVIENFPLGEAALLHLFAVSSICASRIARNPELLSWLSRPEICLARRGYGEMLNDLQALSEGSIAAANFHGLRLWKGRE